MMFGQMTAGSWIYIGSQGIVQGTYETFVEAGRQHYGGSIDDKWIVTAGLGGMGGAQPLAATMAGASMLAIECQQSRIDMRVATRYLDRQARNLDEALALMEDACRTRRPISVGLLGNAAELLPELARRAAAGGPSPHMVTDQTSAHDLVHGYLPAGWSVEEWQEAQRDADRHPALVAAARQSIRRHVEAMLAFHARGIPTVRLRQQHPVRSPSTKASRTRSTFPDSCRRTSARCSAKARAHSGGSRSPAIPRTSRRRIARCASCFRTMRRSCAGSISPASASPIRGCRLASAGWVSASAIAPGWRSTTWWRAAS
jgi:hypothetical protein